MAKAAHSQISFEHLLTPASEVPSLSQASTASPPLALLWSLATQLNTRWRGWRGPERLKAHSGEGAVHTMKHIKNWKNISRLSLKDTRPLIRRREWLNDSRLHSLDYISPKYAPSFLYGRLSIHSWTQTQCIWDNVCTKNSKSGFDAIQLQCLYIIV